MTHYKILWKVKVNLAGESANRLEIENESEIEQGPLNSMRQASILMPEERAGMMPLQSSPESFYNI